MRQPHLAKAFDVHVCGWCGTSMVLVRITPDPEGFEVRSFECPGCDHLFIERVSTDPLKTCKGWVESELKRPK